MGSARDAIPDDRPGWSGNSPSWHSSRPPPAAGLGGDEPARRSTCSTTHCGSSARSSPCRQRPLAVFFFKIWIFPDMSCGVNYIETNFQIVSTLVLSLGGREKLKKNKIKKITRQFRQGPPLCSQQQMRLDQIIFGDPCRYSN